MLKSRQTAPKRASRPLLPYAAPAQKQGAAGCGGRIKAIPEDFAVEEVPAYPFDGEGEHLYLFVEKTGQNTTDVAQLLAGLLGLPSEAVGFAGRKDAQAVTRQWFSLYDRGSASALPAAALRQLGLRVLQTTRHRNKLRLGHLQGNSFRVVIRGVDPYYDPSETATWIVANGFPNYFGAQRLGNAFWNANLGRERFAKGRFGTYSTATQRFQESAYQSALFNDLLAARWGALHSLSKLLVGDLAQLHRNAAQFSVTPDNLAESQHRADAGEISPSLPLIGSSPPWASGWQGGLEQGVLAREGLDGGHTAPPRNGPPGGRRTVRAFATNLRVERHREAGEALLFLRFTLDRGVFATSLLREFMRNDGLTCYGGSWPLPPC